MKWARKKLKLIIQRRFGLREFLIAHGFLDAKGELKKEEAEAIEAALYQEFPSGFVARAAVGVAPQKPPKDFFPTPTRSWLNSCARARRFIAANIRKPQFRPIS